MKTAFDSKPGTIFQKDHTLFQVLKWDYTRNLTWTIIRLRLKDIRSKHIIDRSFSGEELFEDITLDRISCEYLYSSWDTYFFMNTETFEQFEVSENVVWDGKYFLIEWNTVQLQLHQWEVVGLQFPDTVALEIVECDPGIKGNTADGKVVKEATTSTGLTLKVPGFVEMGEKILVNTETKEYYSRAK